MGDGMIFVTRSEPGHKNRDSDHYEPAISYKVMIGVADEATGICISEIRAMRINNHYILEQTLDSELCSVYQDTRRFSRLQGLVSVMDSREEADNNLRAVALNYACMLGRDYNLCVENEGKVLVGRGLKPKEDTPKEKVGG